MYIQKISRADRNLYITLINSGQEDKAFTLFYAKYIGSSSAEFTRMVQAQLQASTEVLSTTELSKISLLIQSQSLALASAQSNVFRDFMENVFSERLFKKIGLTDPKIQRSLLETTIAEFTAKTQGALATTNAEVLAGIRKMQQDLIKANLQIANKRNIPGILDKEVQAFERQVRRELVKNNPTYYKMLNEGKLISSRVKMDGTVNHYTLENYSEMATRTTLLNVQRTSIEISETERGVPVVGYGLIDSRPLKGEEREICKHILALKTGGRSILALDPATAKKLGIMTVTQAREAGAMGVGCRHGLLQLSDKYLSQLAKVFFLDDLSAESTPGMEEWFEEEEKK